MGARSGGGANGGMGSRSGGGASGKIAAAERSIMGNDYETLMAFDEKGNIIYQEKGTKNHVSYDGDKTTDKVVTHNHPGGTAFSDTDIKNAVIANQKEIRVIGKEYTYSIKRPEGGWNRAPSTIVSKYNKIHNKNEWTYLANRTGNVAADRKLKIKLSIDTVTQLTKSFGWNFTVTKN